jgi:hypothetical protein
MLPIVVIDSATKYLEIRDAVPIFPKWKKKTVEGCRPMLSMSDASRCFDSTNVARVEVRLPE